MTIRTQGQAKRQPQPGVGSAAFLPVWLIHNSEVVKPVAKKKKSAKEAGGRKRDTRTFLRYELYGLVIIAFSLLALLTFSNTSWFGRYFAWIFRIVAGSWDFMLPLMGIGIGVYVMAKQKWPYLLAQRWIGVFLLFFSLLVWNHMLLFDELTAGGKFAGQSVLSVTWEQLLQEKRQVEAGKPSTTDVGGGLLGAIGYAFFSAAAGSAGTSLIVVFMVLIGMMLAFQISYVRLFQAVRRMLVAGGARMKAAGQDALVLLSERREQRLREQAERKAYEESLTEEDMQTEEKAERKPSFIARWFGNRNIALTSDETGGEELRHHMAERAAAVPKAGVFLSDAPEPKQAEEIVVHDFAENVYRQEEHALEPESEVKTEGAQIKVKLHGRQKRESKEPLEAPSDLPLAFEGEDDHPSYRLPTPELLDRPKGAKPGGVTKNVQSNVHKLITTLESFGVQAKVLEVQRGPTVTRYEIQPAIGVKVSKIVGLADDIALALAARGIRMEAPIPGKSAIGIEVPNDEVALVTLREVLESREYQESLDKLSIALGRDISGQPIIANLARMPHLLVAGATGSGKSVCINGIIMSILCKAKPSEVKLMMIDPKMVELNVYNGIPHLLSPVVTDPRRASMALKKVVQEMERRYELFAKSGTRDLERYNELARQEGVAPLPLIVVIVDELADLMMVAPGDVEDAICRLAQMARAAGIHLIIATQRPSVDVITGVIKANIPSRIAFGVSSMADSRTILDMGGAEKLLGRGDMLYLPMGASKPVRIQGAFVSDHEVEKVVTFVKSQQEARYHPEMMPGEEETAAVGKPEDELYEQAVELVREAQTASVSLLQRRLRIGYTRAARLVDMMEARGIVGPYEGSKPREVLISRNDSQIS
ncbi:FtsK/SpoIIIE family DNA translocase [Aneurinibacillus sp. XH2]|uniref:FtsK/SpoIIIE family DNA translocase n=1 Tax=Aneurinibacillus sp. XH2 TaxID=1450761 RepID=UPI0009EB0885|nr:DNA translocase FtsK [Aneurinibacillus sp. XH2]